MTRSGSIYVIVFAALAVGRLTAQAHGEECKEFQGSSPEALSTFLQTAAPAFDDPNCIAFALRALGNQRYVPATEVVSKFLDFRRPKTDEEKQGLYLHPQGIDQLYPATYALEMIGQFLPLDQHLDLRGVQHFAFDQRLRDPDQRFAILGEDLLRSRVANAHHLLDFFVNLDGGGFAVVAVLRDPVPP